MNLLRVIIITASFFLFGNQVVISAHGFNSYSMPQMQLGA